MARKIAMISDHASPLAALGGVDTGGQNVYVNELSCQLAELGYEVDVFTRWDDERLPQCVEWRKGIRVIHVKAGPIDFVRKEELLPYMDEFTEHTIGFMQAEETPYTIMHANFWLSGMAAMEIKRRLGVPFVITFHALGKIRREHQGSADKFPQQRERIEESIVANADAIIAECPQDREDLLKLYNANREKLAIIPCGANLQYFHPIDKLLARRILGLPQHERIVLSVGRLVPRKGVDTIIEGMAELRDRHGTEAQLVIVGGDTDKPDPKKTPEIGRLQKLAKKRRVHRQVHFAGRHGSENLKYYYNAADVFVSTPWYEPFGMTPIEAMGCGTPVIGSEVGGIKYSVVDGRTGALVPPKDPEALALRLHEMLNNRKLLGYYSEKGLERVKYNFTWAKVTNSVIHLYEKVLAGTLSQDRLFAHKVTVFNHSFELAIKTMRESLDVLRIPILNAARAIMSSLAGDGKVLICGTGGSASEGRHFASELMGKLVCQNRRTLPVLSLSPDPMFMPVSAEEFRYEDVFARQVEALGQRGDVFIVLSTNGMAPSVVRALRMAQDKGLLTIGLLGGNCGKAGEMTTIPLSVPSLNTQHVEEVHLHLIHAICDLVEKDVKIQN